MTKNDTKSIPAYIGPFTLRNKPKSLYQLQCTVSNAQARCVRLLGKLLPLPDDKVTNDPIAKPFSSLKRQRKNAYEQISAIESYHNALNLLSQYIEWLREVTSNPEDPWHETLVYRVEKSTFDELKSAELFYKDYDTALLKIGIHIPRETAHETEDFAGLFLENRIRKAVIVICPAPFPKNGGYKFRNPYAISEVPGAIAHRITGVKARLRGERKPVASKVSQRNCDTDEAQLRYEKEYDLWETSLYARLVALQNFRDVFKNIAELTSNPDDPWHNVPVHFVREKTFKKFVETDKFYRYCRNPHVMVGVAMAEDTPDTRYQLLQQRRTRQCFAPGEITQHDRFSAAVLLICIPPIPKWPILKWD